MSVKTPIHDFLTDYNSKNQIRCHTPGNKGRVFSRDITEINGADSLYDCNGIIAESERIAARLFGAEKTLYSCSGSTLAVQAMLSLVKTALKSRSDTALRVAGFRYAHRSFVSACALLSFEVDWIYPEEFLRAALSPNAVKAAIKPDTAAVFVNSLDYYGGMCALEHINKICEKSDVPLLVDNAHGAYLAITKNHPLSKGAAMTADSAHKTLPALTGAAYLHINDTRFLPNAKAMTALFGTSSPSYLVLESLDLCNKHIAESKTDAFKLVRDLKQSLIEYGFDLKESDPLRITVKAHTRGYTGIELARIMRENKVECEYADENCTVLLFSTITTKAETKAVNSALKQIAEKTPLTPTDYPLLKPKRAMSLHSALFAPDSNCAVLSAEEAIGKVCAEIIAPCPPGVPLIMPGEIIGGEEARLLKGFGVERLRITT
ncbi:MAG: DegT/DnrJ/EryC1/StrS family aminotransferase [Oscillospiraceae bacterium]|jgi:arginine/lysine/ornithine decarboxylase|nr:DegT/DnrJ/EryC1/StrS family aminotransferase [Oscillospiraceae bacterium]